MKTFTNNMTQKIKSLWDDESAQGATEYILVLVIAVALAIIFKPRIEEFVRTKLGDLEGGLGKIKTE